MNKIYELEFNDDITIDEIYDELIYYKKEGILAICNYKGVLLSNENEKTLRFLVERLKLNMSEIQYDASIKAAEKKKIDYEIYATMISAPKIL